MKTPTYLTSTRCSKTNKKTYSKAITPTSSTLPKYSSTSHLATVIIIIIRLRLHYVMSSIISIRKPVLGCRHTRNPCQILNLVICLNLKITNKSDCINMKMLKPIYLNSFKRTRGLKLNLIKS